MKVHTSFFEMVQLAVVLDIIRGIDNYCPIMHHIADNASVVRVCPTTKR